MTFLDDKIKNLADEAEESSTVLTTEKIIILFLLIIFNFICGCLPGFCNISLKKLKHIIGFTNTFSSSVSLAAALFLILPQARKFGEEFFEAEGAEEKYGHIVSALAWPFFLCFAAYSLSLLIQKVIFSFGEGGHAHSHEGHDHSKKSGEKVSKEDLKLKQEEEIERAKEEDENEEAFKAVVGSRGRFGSFLNLRTLKKSFSKEGQEFSIKKGSIVRASMYLSRSMAKPDLIKGLETKYDDMDLLVNPKKLDLSDSKNEIKAKEMQKKQDDNVHEDEHKHKHDVEHDHDHEHEHEAPAKSSLMAYVLLGAISFQGIFEGISIGVLEDTKSILGIGLSILVFKSLQSLSMGMILKLSGLNAVSVFRMLFMFIMFTPLGILIGSLTEMNNLLKALFLGICVGSLIYQTASEIVIEEFTFTKNRYSKFFTFLGGAACVALFAILSKIK